MKISKLISCIVLSIPLLVSVSAVAAPSSGIRALIATPASVFDVFLYQLYIASNGPAYFGGPNMKEQLRIFDLSYDYDSNLITMKFHIGPEHKLLKGFGSQDIEGKKTMLLRAAKEIAADLGLEARTGIGRLGLIQDLKIRNGWLNKDFDEKQVKDEIANRTVFELFYSWEEKTVYKVRRTESGRYEFSMDAKSTKF